MPDMHLLQKISRCNQRCIANTGDIDKVQIAGLIEVAMSLPDRQKSLLALAEYVGSAMSGSVPRLPK